MKYFKINVFIIIILAFFSSAAFAARIEISAPGEQTIPLAMTRLLPMGVGAAQPAVATEFQQVLQGDLELSGLFDLVDPASFLSDAGRLGLRRTDIDFQQWRMLGTETLIKGGYSISAGKVTIELRLFDVITQRLLTGRRYSGKLTDGFAIPADACKTYTAMLQGMAALEQDMHRHSHKENNILFPRAAKLEAERTDPAYSI